MKRYLKYGLISVGVLSIALAALIALVTATFDPNDYKPLIVKLMQEKKQRTLKIEGDIKLAFFPRLGVDLGRFSLSERNSTEEFAAVESARVSLALLPLLRKELVVGQIRVAGARARLVRYEDGSTNIDDLLRKEEERKFRFDIDSVKVANAALTLEDRMGGRRFVLSELAVNTGRLADGKPGEVDLGFRLRSDSPRLDARLKARSGLLFDTAAKRLKLTQLDTEVRGAAGGIAELAASMQAGLDFDGAAKTVAVENLALALAGRRGTGDLDIRLVVPRLRWSAGSVSAEKVNLVAQLQQTGGHIDAVLSLPALAGPANSFRAGKLVLEVNGKQGDTEFKSRLETPLAGSLETKRLELPSLRAHVTLANPAMPSALKEGGKGLRADIGGSARIDLEAQDVALDAVAKLDASNIQAKVGASRFDRPRYRFDVAIDQLDLDRYLPQKPVPQPEKEKPFDLSALKELDASGSLRVGELKVANIKSGNVRLNVNAPGRAGEALQKELKRLFK